MSKPKPAKPAESPRLAARIQPLLWALEHGGNRVKEEMGDSDQAVYTRHCLALLDNPELIGRPEWHAVMVKILKSYVALHPLRAPTAPEIAWLVDRERLVRPKMSLAEACRIVVRMTGKTFEAVKQAHRRYGARLEG